MKCDRAVILAFVVVLGGLMMTVGCEYDVAKPQWEQNHSTPATPEITRVEPAQATAGVNTITIHGENFASALGTNVVYIGNSGVGTEVADIITTSGTSITVRRPTKVSDACTLKVSTSEALLVAKYGPYKIAPVVERDVHFLDGTTALSAAAVDNSENLYVVEAASRNVVKVAPAGDKSVVGQVTRAPTDIRIGPDGRLYSMGSNRIIEVVNFQDTTTTTWVQMPSGKLIRFGDFDANGYLYCGGPKTDLMIVNPDLSTRAAGVYPTSGTTEIVAVRVYGGFVYLATRPNSTSPATIWRHSIDGQGNLGPQETVLEMSATPFASRVVKGIVFSSTGLMYIATDSADPLLVFNPQSAQLDYFYKSILPSRCKYFAWGAGNLVYMIRGDTGTQEAWEVHRVDMGTTVGR